MCGGHAPLPIIRTYFAEVGGGASEDVLRRHGGGVRRGDGGRVRDGGGVKRGDGSGVRAGGVQGEGMVNIAFALVKKD